MRNGGRHNGMGGNVTIAVRRDGEVRSHILGTGAIPVLCQDMDFLNGNPGRVKTFWNGLGKGAPFAPHGYGLVVIDLDGKWIGSIQKHYDPSEFFGSTVLMSRNGRRAPADSHDLPLEHELFEMALAKGAIRRVKTSQGARYNLIANMADLSLDPGQLQSFYRTLEQDQQRRGTARRPAVDAALFEPEGWLFQKFPEDQHLKGWHDLAVALIERGFSFHPEDGQSWQRHCQTITEETPGPNVFELWQQAMARSQHRSLEETVAESKKTRNARRM